MPKIVLSLFFSVAETLEQIMVGCFKPMPMLILL